MFWKLQGVYEKTSYSETISKYVLSGKINKKAISSIDFEKIYIKVTDRKTFHYIACYIGKL